jgi:hypothetical protein
MLGRKHALSPLPFAEKHKSAEMCKNLKKICSSRKRKGTVLGQRKVIGQIYIKGEVFCG